jgi:2-methylcitrate dehydratase PrpD
VSGESQARYRDAFLDWMACAIGGRAEPAARAAREAGDTLLDRVAAVGTAGHVLDFDDTYLPGVAHLSAPTVPAALVLGAERGASAAEVLAAYAAGFEAAGAMARAAHPALYDGGWHPTPVCGALGAAVTASRLLELSAEAERSAAGLALLRAGGFRSAFGSAGKSLQVGMASSAGVAAARLAAAGAEVDLEQIARGPGGFETAFGAGFEQPGEGTAIEENWIKAYPCCLQTHAVIEAAVAARDAGAIEVEPSGAARPAIEVTVPPVSLQAAWVTDPTNGLEAKFSIPYMTALTFLHGAPDTASFEGVDDRVRDLARSVRVSVDPQLADSEVLLAVDGSRVARIEAALGSPQRPMTEDALAAKRVQLAGDRLEAALDDPQRPAVELLETLDA